MSLFFNIQTIAKYERRILLRSWFFRIFAILSLFIIGMYGALMVFNYNPFTWMFRSLPSALPYSNFYFLNIFQSIIAVFLATDFMKRDKKLNTSEVLFIRPMSNFEYIAGKTWGLLSVFVILNLLVMILSVVFMLISEQLVMSILPVVYYFFLISIPSLVFIVGLSFVLMSIIRNQPVTFIILLGYIALVLFYLGDKSAYIFDYMVYEMPMSYSEVIGFSDLKHQIIHRLSYLFAGLAFLFFSVWRLNRLPGKNSMRIVPAFVSVLLLLVAMHGFNTLYSHSSNKQNQRDAMVALSARYFNYPSPEMLHASIEATHGEVFSVKSELTLLNSTGVPIDTLILSLNPGFKVQKIEMNQAEVSFTQEKQIIIMVLPESMNTDQKAVVAVSYQGIPDFSVCYLDHDFETFESFQRAMTLRIENQYGFYSSDYVLLTPESIWYPVSGISYDPSRPAIFNRHFTEFDLTVKTGNGMLPISQGKRSTSDSLAYHFSIRDPLPQLTLVIGQYAEHVLDIEGIEIKLNHFEGHDFFSEHLNELGDTLVDLVINFIDDFERPLNMFYPYPDFSLVEVPVQFASLPRSWTSTLEQSQPQMVLYPEWGFNQGQADFYSSLRRTKRQSERNNEELSERELQARVFSGFMNSVFGSEETGMRFGQGGTQGANPFNIFPNYFYYVNYITSDECPVLNYAFESYLKRGSDSPRQMFMGGMSGIGDNERANLMLRDKSLKQIIAEETDKQAVNRVLQAKGSYLLSWMERQIDDPDFESYLLNYLYDNSYRTISYEQLISDLSNEFSVEMGAFLNDWYTSSSLPAFELSEVSVTETVDQSQTVYVVQVSVTNHSNTDGMVRFTFQLGSGGRGGGGFMGGGFGATQEPEERIFLIDANQTANIQMVLFDSPRSMIFNTLLSQNIPSSILQFGLRTQRNDNLLAEEFIHKTERVQQIKNHGEYIVDNTDEGFSIHDPSLDNPLRQFVERYREEGETEFAAQAWQAPSTWSKMANADYYGIIERSAMVVRSGDGSKAASWQTEIENRGYYSVYAYLNQERRFGPGRRGGGSDPEGKYVYTIYHDDGVEDIEIEVRNFETGWNYLGNFFISSDTAKVVLSDKGGASRVIADAIKWELQR